jgi:hypothetical protein
VSAWLVLLAARIFYFYFGTNEELAAQILIWNAPKIQR